jgi:hypothetical protein
VNLDDKTLYDLAQRFSPVLRFHPDERFFPVLAESWLTHTTEAPWPDDTGHILGDLASDAHQRGMALWAPDDRGALRVLAGQPIDGDRPLRFSDDPDDAYAIGRLELRTVTKEVFLDLAGWVPDSNRSSGDADRLYALYSELAAAVNESMEWTPLHGRDDLPHAWIPPSVNPTTYCEITWAGTFHRANDSAGLSDFPPADGSLDDYLAFTYHYFYAAKEPPPDGDGPRLEGQWEAITLFFHGEKIQDPRGAISLPPAYVVVSQGIDQPGGDHHRTQLRPWSGVELLGTHPVLYVGKGTHHFYFEPVGGTTGNPPPSDPNPGSDPGPHDDDPHEGSITDFLILFLILLALAALVLYGLLILLAIGAVGALFYLALALAVILLVLALWALFEWIKSLFDSGDNDNSGTPVPGGNGNDEAGDDGTQGGGDEPPGGSAPPGSSGGSDGYGGVGGSTGGSVGLPNTGSPTGRATVSFDVRVVDRLFGDPNKFTGYPAERPLENPYWWDFSGGWGVRVNDGFSSGWQDGTRRTDEHRRSWGYWNGLRLSTVLHGGADQG